MAKITESLGASIKEKVFGVVKSKASSRESPDALLKVIGKNFMAMSAMARDMNVASQNIKELVRVMGGKPSDKEDKVAGSGLTADERERKLAVELEKDKQKEEPKKPSLVSKLGKKALDKFKSTKVGQKVTDKFAELKKAFNPAKIFKALSKYLVIGALIGVIFVAFKDSFVEWATGLFDAIKTKFDEFTDSIKQWFQDTIQPIIEKAKELIQPVIDAVSGFITKIGDWFKEKFELIKGIFENPLNFIKNVIDKVSGVIDGIKETLTGWAEKLLSSKATSWMVPDFVKDMIKKPAKLEAGETDAETKKLQRQQAQVLEQQETERVKKLEKEKQYTGDDEIVRARLGLPPKTESMRQEEESKKQAQPVEVAPPPQSILVPGPMPTPAAPKGKAAAPLPKEAPKPISAQPPTAVGKAAEPPGKQAAGGSLASVASVQSGVDLSGLHPEFEKRLVNMATAFNEQTGKKLLITSAYRSNEKQAELFKAKVAQLGGDERAAAKLVARPMPPLGTGRGSFHLKGLAIDINSKGPGGLNALAGSRDSPTGWLEKFGLIRNVPREDWHVQPSGTLPTADNPENPGAPVLVAGKDGKPMDLSSGKKESLGQPEAKPSATGGGAVASASTEVASGQRQQAKPSTPIIVNAPTTNNQVIQNNTVAAKKSSVDANKQLMSRAA
jgi:LAS superfamily LD-carboxypeptidase LdcB